MATEKQLKKQELIKRRANIASMYAGGRYQADIAIELDISIATVERDLRIIRKQWLESSVRDFDQVKAEQLAKLDKAEKQAWEQWDRSCRDHEKVITETKRATRYRGTNSRKEVSPQCGDPRYLSVVLLIIERRCKLLGLDEPEKRQLTGPNGGPVQTQDLTDEKLREELERLGLKPKKRQLDDRA